MQTARIIGTETYILTRVELGTMLANKDFTGFDQLATKALHTQTLGIRIATIAGTSATFLMCHLASSLCNDLVDRNQGVPLAVTLGPFIALAALLFEHSDLVTLEFAYQGRLDHCISYIQVPNFALLSSQWRERWRTQGKNQFHSC